MRYFYNAKDGRINEHGQTVYSTPLPWSSLAAIDQCQCDDGKRRKVEITGEPDTFFSAPARVTVKGKTVSGYVTTDNGEYWFHATGKNRDMIKKTLCQCQARNCSTCGSKAPCDKYRRAVISLLHGAQAMQSLCDHCAGIYGETAGYKDKTCEESEIESDAYYGAMRGMTGAEYKVYITKQYE